MALAIATVTDSISKLTVTGLTIKDMNEIPVQVEGRNCPVLYPEPIGFQSNWNAEKAAFGEGAGSKWNITYDLKYTLCYAPLGSSRGLELFGSVVTMRAAFLDAILICNPQSGAVLIRPAALEDPGPVSDPSGNQFFGCTITVHVLEFVN